VISEYLESLASALSFDQSLSRCVRQEVEDHLREAVAVDPAGDGLEAERRAVAKFGDPRLIAAQFAVVSLTRQTRRVGVAVILIVAAVFFLMKVRVTWYATTHWAMSDDLRAVAGVVGMIDRYSFWLSVIIAIGALVYVSGGRIPQTVHPAYCNQITRFFLACTVAAGALVISVIGDGVLTALQLFGTVLRAGFVVPIFSMAIEITCLGVIIYEIRSAARRMAFTKASLAERDDQGSPRPFSDTNNVGSW
jgi:hypothetical protein